MQNFCVKRKAQQLVEFLLVAPFLVIMIGILTEYAYALNINMTLNQGLKTVTSSIYSQIKPSMSTEEIQQQIKNNLSDYLISNNAPVNDENQLTVSYVIEGQSAIFMTHYKYIPAFTLPNVYFKILPEEFDFVATVSIPKAFLGENNYDTSLSSEKLDGIWGATDFENINKFNANKYGILKSNDSNGGRDKMLFLLTENTDSSKYRMVHWDGSVENCILDSATGNVSGDTCGGYNNQNFVKYLLGNNYYNVIFVHDDTTQDLDIDTTTLSAYWFYDKEGNPIMVSNSTDLTQKNTDGILKRAVALIDLASNASLGNFDNCSVGSYNSDVVAPLITAISYKMTSFGSIIFVHTANDLTAITNSTAGVTPVNVNYNFNQ